MTNLENDDNDDCLREDSQSVLSVLETSLIHRLWKSISQWFNDAPVKNSIIIALLLVVVVSGAIAFLILVGAVKISNPDTKGIWLEVNYQILTVIFTIATIFDQPARIRALVLSGKFLYFRSKISNPSTRANLVSKCIANFDKTIDMFMKYFPYAISQVKTPDDIPTIVVSQDGSQVKIQMDSIDNSREKLEIRTNSYQIHCGFLISAVSFNISTLAQIVVSATMFCVQPYQTRPFIPVAIGVPVAFLTSGIGAGYQAYLKHKYEFKQSVDREQ